ncbi:MAG: hypothetical protein ACJ0GV_01965 [Dehalococcoidia bacterium]|mgnify:CR=1 FL=1|tara:strand:- start:435 stop:626 length:192 start_codon:yes stop_codon:yes gene_type:complete
MEELINRVVNSITLAIFGIILWSLIIFLISKLRKKEVKNFNVRALIIFVTFFVIGLIANVSLI